MGESSFAERFLHIDMDAFYVEVERLRDPALRGVPVVVGGLGNRGVVASASYEARELGVRSAMPIVEARRRAPKATFVPPDMREYGRVSRRVFDVIESVTPFIERLSIDEAFLDVGGLRMHHPSPEVVAARLRSRIAAEVGIPASTGVSAVKFIAKMASGDAKPDGSLVIAAGEELAYLHPKPVRALWGVGQATYAALDALGIATIGDVASTPVGVLQRRLGPSLGAHLHELAQARDPRDVTTDGAAKSVSVESTFAADLVDAEEIDARLIGLCDELSMRLRRHELAGRTVTLKVRFGDFTTFTRSMTPADPVATRPALLDAARVLLARVERRGRPVRLLGIGVSHLQDATESAQLTMFEGTRGAAAEVVEEVRKRFGDKAIGVGRLAPRGRLDASEERRTPS
jgi:DNA polymerase-4